MWPYQRVEVYPEERLAGRHAHQKRSNMGDLYSKIVIELKKQSDPRKVKRDSFYHKYGGYKSYGVATPILRSLIVDWSRSMSELSCRSVLSLVHKLYSSDIEEQILLANAFLSRRLECISSLKLVDEAADHLHTWSATDDSCGKIVQPLLMERPKEVLPLLRRWNKASSRWKRRASVVAFTRKVGESGLFVKEALELCNNLAFEEDDLIRKAVGWALKDMMRGNKRQVLAYVKKLRREGASAVVTLYAIRELRGKERQEILISVKPSAI